MSLFSKSCSICSAPPDVLTAVNEALAKREKLRPLATRSGFSRAALSRHNRKCRGRRTIEAHREKLNTGDAFFTLWPGETLPANLPASVGWIARVQYQQTNVAECGNPRALPFDERTAGSFYDAAKAEDAERAQRELANAPETSPPTQ
jgi:hypothetical protein